MTKKEFIEYAKLQNKDKEETRKKFLSLDSLGMFDDSKKIETSIETKNGRGLFGLSPESEAVIFPKASKVSGVQAVGTDRPTSEALRQDIQGALDLISVPGRTAASLPGAIQSAISPDESFVKSFVEGFKRTEAKKGSNKVTGFIENLVRDPITTLAAIGSGGTSVAAAPLKQVLLQNLQKGTISQVLPAVTRQISRSAETGEINVPEQVAAATIEAGLGGLGEAGGTLLSKGVSIPSKFFMKTALKVKDATAKKIGPSIETGINNAIKTIDDFNLESSTGGMQGIVRNAEKAIKQQSGVVDNLISEFTNNNPGVTVDIDNTFLRLMDDFDNYKILDVFSDEKRASKILGEIFTSLDKMGLTGNQPVSKLPAIKSTITKGLKLFKKGPYNVPEDPLKKKVGELAYFRLRDELEQFIPEIATPNRNLHNLKNAKLIAQEAADKWEKKGIFGLSDLSASGPAYLLAQSLKGSQQESAGAALSMLILKKMSEAGRGPSFGMTLSKSQLFNPDLTRILTTNTFAQQQPQLISKETVQKGISAQEAQRMQGLMDYLFKRK